MASLSMQASIIIPTFNRRAVVLRTVSALLRQDFPPSEYEIIVVVDGSTDNTADALRSIESPCRLQIIEHENRGPSAARNTGFRAAQGNLLIFLDDDMLCDRSLIAEHVAAHTLSGRIVAFGALFLSPDSPRSLAAECFIREIGAIHLAYRRDTSTPWDQADCVFSNSSISRELFEQSGGFDEAFRKREDLELGIRLFKAGVQPLYRCSAIAYQYYAKTDADLIQETEAFAEGDLLFARKHPDANTKGQWKWLSTEPHWKIGLRRIAAARPALVDALLSPVCFLGTIFFRFSFFRNAGVRALQIRRRMHWLHRVLILDKHALEFSARKIL
jgi:GT2 family glycosyltransferase